MVPCCSHGCFSWLWSRDRVLPPPLYPVCASCRCCWGRRCGTCCLELIILKCGACQSKRGGNKLASVVTTTCDHPGERERERERGGGGGSFMNECVWPAGWERVLGSCGRYKQEAALCNHKIPLHPPAVVTPECPRVALQYMCHILW